MDKREFQDPNNSGQTFPMRTMQADPGQERPPLFSGSGVLNEGQPFIPERAAGSSLDVFAEMHARISSLEASNKDLHAKLDAATKRGEMDPELLPRVAHVMMKYFPHDMAETEAPSAPVPKFDAFTGERLN